MARLKFSALVVLLAATVLGPAPTYAAKIKPTVDLNTNGLIIKRKYTAAFAQTLNRAKNGDANAQYHVAVLYRLGLGTAKDEGAAKTWLNAASKKGSAKAAALLTRMNQQPQKTLKKSADPQAGNATSPQGRINFASLPQRAPGQTDWLSLAVARNSDVAIDGILAKADTNSTRSLALVTATKNQDVTTVNKLLAAHILATSDIGGHSPLSLAIALGNDELMNILVESDAKQAASQQVLQLIAQNCLASPLTKILGVAGPTTAKPSLSVIAKYCGNWPSFKDLYSGSDLNAVDSQGRTAAWYAAAKGDTSLLAWLAKFGADLALADHDGVSPLHSAAVHNQAFSVRYILSLFDKTDFLTARGTTPLMLAAFTGCNACIKTLLEKSGDVDLKNADGDTGLMFAVRGQQNSTATLLLAQGANPDARNSAGETPGKVAERLNVPLLKGTAE
jgi:ankyrin repeat protein